MYPHLPSSARLTGLPLPPRDVVRRRPLAVPWGCVVFLLFPPVWIGIFLIWTFVTGCALELFGQERTATVSSRQYVPTKQGGEKCEIRYIYNDQSGRHTGRGSLAGSAYRLYPAGASISIRSVRILGFSQSRLGSHSVMGSVVCPGFSMLICNGIVFLIFYPACLAPLSQRKLQRRLLREGDAVMGRITDKTVRNRKTSYQLSYIYYLVPAGPPRNGSMMVRRRDYDLAKTGDDAIVFFDPRAPERSVLYEYSQYGLREWRERENQKPILKR